MVRTIFYNFGRLWEISPEPSRLELSFLNATLLPNALYNLTKFHENSSNCIGVMGRTRFRLQGQGDRYIPEPIGRRIKNQNNKRRIKMTATEAMLKIYLIFFPLTERPVKSKLHWKSKMVPMVAVVKIYIELVLNRKANWLETCTLSRWAIQSYFGPLVYILFPWKTKKTISKHCLFKDLLTALSFW